MKNGKQLKPKLEELSHPGSEYDDKFLCGKITTSGIQKWRKFQVCRCVGPPSMKNR
jgi:hypothetical protein